MGNLSRTYFLKWAIVLLGLTYCVSVHSSTFIVTNADDAGAGSLRQAILDANAVLGSDSIAFNIDGANEHTINLLSGLPVITRGVIIDGLSQNIHRGVDESLRLIIINGLGAGDTSGLSFQSAGGGKVRQLVLQNFQRNGITLNACNDFEITGCFIGTEQTATSGASNQKAGIEITRSNNVVIGSSLAERYNVISGNGLQGICIRASEIITIQNCRIGMNLLGNGEIPNQQEGILIKQSAQNIQIGGHNSDEGNVISGNAQSGISIQGNSHDVSVFGNMIGVGLNGFTAFQNGQSGVEILSMSFVNTIGSASSRNIIAGNGQYGIHISGTGTVNNRVINNYLGVANNGTSVRSNGKESVRIDDGAANNEIGGQFGTEGNLINGSGTSFGIIVHNADHNEIEGNLIGLSQTEGYPSSQMAVGIELSTGAAHNIIGGENAGQGNVIGYCLQSGVLLNNVNNNRIYGNKLGAGSDGNSDKGNGQGGIVINNGSVENTIGGIGLKGNQIAGNDQFGILLTGAGTDRNQIHGNNIGGNLNLSGRIQTQKNIIINSGASENNIGGGGLDSANIIVGASNVAIEIEGVGTDQNRVSGNFIGINSADLVIRNENGGVNIYNGASGNIIGGPTIGHGNVISGNLGHGIRVLNNTITGTQIEHNLIGTSVDGLVPIPNTGYGVELNASLNGVIKNNVISGNNQHGVYASDLATGWTMIGNLIGVGSDTLTAIPNIGSGILLNASSGNAIVGGETPDSANYLWFNTQTGISLHGDGTQNVRISGNSFNLNNQMPIELGGAGRLSNDPGDGDGGPNFNLNWVEIDSAAGIGNTQLVWGRYTGAVNKTFRIEIYINSDVGTDISSAVEGKEYLGNDWITTDPSGTVSFVIEVPSNRRSGVISAIMIEGPNTSEFSDNVYSIYTPDKSPGGISEGLGLWLKGDEGVVQSVNKVLEWQDQSGNDRHINQTTESERPIVNEREMNFNPSLLFNGGQWLEDLDAGDYLNGLTGLSMFFVAKSDVVGSDHGVFSTNSAVTDNNFGFRYDSSGAGSTFDNSFKFGMNAGGVGANYEVDQNLQSLYPQIVSHDWSSGQLSELELNGEPLTIQGSPTIVTDSISNVEYLTIGRASFPGELSWMGEIAEVILFERDVADAEKQQIQSYLAIKYGLTLGGAGGFDYLSSNGTLIFEGTGDFLDYRFNVAGIGMDTMQSLVQTMSKSSNEGARLTISNPSELQNQGYLVWGHNGGELDSLVQFNDQTDIRWYRTWRVKKTGNVGSTDLAFDLSNLGLNSRDLSDFRLLRSNAPDFSSSLIADAATEWVGDTLKFLNIDFNDTEYFTLGFNQISPGQVANGMEVWFRADSLTYLDAGNTISSNNDPVQEWHDLSTNKMDAKNAGTGRPILSGKEVNFNPSLTFDGMDDGLQMPLYPNDPLLFGAGGYEFFFVGDHASGTGGTYYSQQHCSYENLLFQINSKADRISFRSGDHPDEGHTYISVNPETWNLFSFGRDEDTMRTFLFGNSRGTAYNGDTIDDAGGQRWIGKRQDCGGTDEYNGRIAEMIVYSRSLTSLERQKINTYLAIKYGISLDASQDYISPNGNVIFDASNEMSGFTNDIAGIGKSKSQGLSQVKSRSVNDSSMVIIGTPSSFSDEEYLLWGNNGVSPKLIEREGLPADVSAKQKRVWKVDHTGDAGSVNVSVLKSYLNDQLFGKEQFYLLTSADLDFSDATRWNSSTVEGDTVLFENVVFTDNDYFTLGIGGLSFPVAVNDTFYMDEESKDFSLSVLMNDTDVELNIDSLSLVMVTSFDSIVANVQGSRLIGSLPTDYFGIDSAQYMICDSTNLCDTAWVFVVVNNVPDAPVLTSDTLFLKEDSTASINLYALIFDVEGDLDSSFLSVDAANLGSHSLLVDGTYSFQGNENVHGLDSVKFSICDQSGLCDTNWLFIRILPVADGPVARDTSLTVLEDSVLIDFDIQQLVLDADNNLDWSTLTLTFNGVNGTGVLSPSNGLNYTPFAHFNGVDSLMYKVCDSTALCDSVLITINVLPVADAPVLNLDTLYVFEDSSNSISLFLLITDVDDDVDSVSLTVSTPQVGQGNLEPSGLYTFIAPMDFSGLDSVNFSVCDKSGLCDSSTLFIRIFPVSDPPVARDTTLVISEDSSFTDFDLNAIVSDPENGINWNSTEVLHPVNNGVALLNNPGLLSYTPTLDFNGQDSLLFKVCDNTLLCDSAWVRITVLSRADPPVFLGGTVVLPEDTVGFEVQLDTITFVSDIDDDIDKTSFSSLSGPFHGAAGFNSTKYSYTPTPNFNGLDSVLVRVCDDSLLCDSGWVVFHVTPVNDPPVMKDTAVDIYAGCYAQDINLDALFSDVDGGEGQFTLQNDAQFTDLVINGSTLTLQFSPYQFTQVAVEIIGCDVELTCDTAVVAVDFIPQPRPQLLQDTLQVTLGEKSNYWFEEVFENGDQISKLNLESIATMANDSIELNATSLVDLDTLSTSFEVCDSLCFCDTLILYHVILAPNNTVILPETAILGMTYGCSVTSASIYDLGGSLPDVSEIDSLRLFNFSPPSLESKVSITDDGLLTIDFSTESVLTGFSLDNENLSFDLAVQDRFGNGDQVTVNLNALPNEGPQLVWDSTTFVLQGELHSFDSDQMFTGTNGLKSIVFEESTSGIAVTLNDDSSKLIFPYDETIQFLDDDIIEFIVTDSLCLTKRMSVTLRVLPNPNVIVPYEGFSPNNDDQNDLWEVQFVDRFYDNHLEIFNRWGDLIFEMNGFGVDGEWWNGVGNVGMADGQVLPDGTYFYMLDLGVPEGEKIGNRILNGYITLKK